MLGKLDEDKRAQPLVGQAIGESSAIVRAIQPSARSRRSRLAIADGDSGDAARRAGRRFANRRAGRG